MGVRIRCDLEREDGGDVRYSIRIDADESMRGSASVRLETGDVTWGAWSPLAPDDETLRLARAFLRAAWSATRKKSPEPWPRKIERWRE